MYFAILIDEDWRCDLWKKRGWWKKWCYGAFKNKALRYFGKDKKGKSLTLAKACKKTCKATSKSRIYSYTSKRCMVSILYCSNNIGVDNLLF